MSLPLVFVPGRSSEHPGQPQHDVGEDYHQKDPDEVDEHERRHADEDVREKWLVIPYSFETNDMKLWRPPGTSAPNDFFDYLKAAFDCLYEEDRTYPQMLSVGLHMRPIGRPGHVGPVREELSRGLVRPPNRYRPLVAQAL
jgi:hypothetical protein